MMIKHPAFRVANIVDVRSAILLELWAEMEAWAALLPCATLITDFEIVGSYARGVAELHSDLDINIATDIEKKRLEAIRQYKSDKAARAIAARQLKALWTKYGMRIDVALQDAKVKSMREKCCYSLRDQRFYGTEKRRMDINYITKIATERTRQRDRPQKLSLSAWDEELGDYVPFDPAKHDPWASILPEYRKLYGKKLLEYGKTPETAHMREA